MRNQLLALVAIAVLGAGCASGSPEMTSNTAPLRPMSQHATVQVQNHNWSDMVVYAVRDNHRVRLGMVTSMNTETFRLPQSFAISTADVRLMANPIGSNDSYLTEPIVVNPGQRVELRLENMLSISNWAVW